MDSFLSLTVSCAGGYIDYNVTVTFSAGTFGRVTGLLIFTPDTRSRLVAGSVTTTASDVSIFSFSSLFLSPPPPPLYSLSLSHSLSLSFSFLHSHLLPRWWSFLGIATTMSTSSSTSVW